MYALFFQKIFKLYMQFSLDKILLLDSFKTLWPLLLRLLVTSNIWIASHKFSISCIVFKVVTLLSSFICEIHLVFVAFLKVRVVKLGMVLYIILFWLVLSCMLQGKYSTAYLGRSLWPLFLSEVHSDTSQLRSENWVADILWFLEENGKALWSFCPT